MFSSATYLYTSLRKSFIPKDPKSLKITWFLLCDVFFVRLWPSLRNFRQLLFSFLLHLIEIWVLIHVIDLSIIRFDSFTLLYFSYFSFLRQCYSILFLVIRSWLIPSKARIRPSCYFILSWSYLFSKKWMLSFCTLFSDWVYFTTNVRIESVKLLASCNSKIDH